MTDKKVGAPPKDPQDKYIKASISVPPHQINEIIAKGYVVENNGRFEGLSKFTQYAYDLALKD
jgi:hypothetical protein